MKLANIRIGKKLTLLIGLTAVGWACSIGVGLWGVQKLTAARQAGLVEARKMLLGEHIETVIRKINQTFAVAVIGRNYSDAVEREIAEQRTDYMGTLKELKALSVADEGNQRLQAAEDALAKGRKFVVQGQELAKNQKYEEASAVFGNQVPAENKFFYAAMADYLVFRQQALKKNVEQQDALAAEIRLVMIGFGLTSLALVAIVGVLITRNITAPLGIAVARLGAVAKGDVSQDVPPEHMARKDEIGMLAQALQTMCVSLREMLKEINRNAEQVASASAEISAGATEQSQGMAVQKDQTQQVSTAMHEMASSVGQISESSSRAADAAQKATQAAQSGGRIVEQTLDNIQSIAASVSQTADQIAALGKSSDQIGKIIGVIDDIADQTNLLALNAAIEAARAGEQGRGFAVVADEVRKLAERTTTATKEITGMIQGIQQETRNAVEAMQSGTKKVESGVATTRQAGESLQEIIASAGQVGEMVTQIVTAAHQQTSVTEEVNRHLTQIAKVTVEAAAGAQESAKACEGLSNLAFDLQNVVGQFKTGTEAPSGGSRSQSGPAGRRRQEEHVYPAYRSGSEVADPYASSRPGVN
jgi:methyl-accepting chemotaxis protein